MQRVKLFYLECSQKYKKKERKKAECTQNDLGWVNIHANTLAWAGLTFARLSIRSGCSGPHLQ